MILQVATHKDIGFIAKVCRSMSSIYNSIMPGAFERQAHKFMTKGLPTEYTILIIIVNDIEIGFLGYKELDINKAYLVALYVLDEYQRRGYGQMALRQWQMELSRKGYTDFLLLVHKDADWAKKFYLKNGWDIISDKIEDIQEYDDGILKGLVLPNTILMDTTT